MLTSFLIIVLMLLLSAFFSGMEIAFTTKNRLRLEIDRKQSRMFDYIADIFARHPGQYITTILVGNNIALVIYSLFMSMLLRALVAWVGWTEVALEGSVALETIVSTIIIIFVAEFLPKSVFRSSPNFYYRFFAPVIYFFYLLLFPIAQLTTWIAQGLLWIFGGNPKVAVMEPSFDRNDLASLLETSKPEPQQEAEQEIKIFQNALDFADLRVRDCMVPRVDMEAVDLDDTTIEALTARFVETKYSRIFVWEGSVDNIVGYVNSKSLFQCPKSIQEVLMEVQYVPETMPLQTVMQALIRHKSNIAVVIDEFGGTAGIISLEDILEQIFGEIEDEHDVPDLTEKQLDDSEYIFSCRLEVEYLNEKYDLGIPESEEYETLAGFIIFHYQGLPAVGDVIRTEQLEIKILRRTRSRLELARVKRL